MDPLRVGLFDLAEQRLAWADRRQELLARNIANIDTPGYVAKDVGDFLTALGQSGTALARTEPGHLPGTRTSRFDAAGGTRPDARALDGNAVSMDQQLTKVADTDTTQQLVTSLFHKYLGLFQLAIGRNS